jgi:hypothetical protein
MVNPGKLHRELAAAGIPILSVSEDGTYILDIIATQEQIDAAAVIVAAHDPVDYEYQNAEAERAALYDIIDATVDGYNTALTNWLTLTDGQRVEVLLRNTQVLRRILIYLRHDLRNSLPNNED